MKKIYCLVFVLLLYVCNDTYGQKKSNNSGKSKSTKSGGQSSSGGSSKNFGVGLRLGDPLGLTMKGYFGKVALEFNLGRSFLWGYGYNRYYKYDYRGYGYYDPYYPYYDPKNPYWKNYRNARILSLQLHLYKQKAISSVKGLEAYFGGGLQYRHFRYGYFYYDRFRRVYEGYFTQNGIGADVVGGLEYTLSSMPLTFFGDLNLYVEFYEVPFWLALQGGLGVRFNF